MKPILEKIVPVEIWQEYCTYYLSVNKLTTRLSTPISAKMFLFLLFAQINPSIYGVNTRTTSSMFFLPYRSIGQDERRYQQEHQQYRIEC